MTFECISGLLSIKPFCLCALVDSTESSGENMTLFSSSDHSCLSAISGEIVDDSSVLSQSSQRKNSSPAVTRKKPGVPPKPLQPAKAQVQEKV